MRDAILIVLLPELVIYSKKIQAGKDQEKAQPERKVLTPKTEVEKKQQQSGTNTIKTYRKPNEQLFPNRWPLSYMYLNLTKNR